MARLDWDNKGGHKTTHAYLEVTPRCVGSQLQWPAQNHSLMCNGLLHVKFSASFQCSHSGQVSGTMDRSIGRCQVLSSTRPYCKKWQWCNSTKAVIKSQLHNGAYKVHAIAPFALLIQKFKLSQVSLTVTSPGQWPVSWKFWGLQHYQALLPEFLTSNSPGTMCSPQDSGKGNRAALCPHYTLKT